MRSLALLFLALAASLAAATVPAFFRAGKVCAAPSGLVEALRAEDKEHLEAKAPELQKDKSKRLEFGWDENDSSITSKSRTISDGDILAEVSFKTVKIEGEKARIPRVVVKAGGKEVGRFEQSDSMTYDPPVAVQIAELDPSNQSPEVVVSFFTGGAHCCSDTSVLARVGDTAEWRTIGIGEFDGGPLLATDLDGDGRFEFATRDNSFLYTFGCYACSAAPQKILAIDGGEVKTVSAEPRYRPAHVGWLKDLISAVEPETEPNPFLAGYVAEKVLLGEGKRGWDLMLAHYDKTLEPLEICDKPLDNQGACPGEMVKLGFPDALKRHLDESGYPITP